MASGQAGEGDEKSSGADPGNRGSSGSGAHSGDAKAATPRTRTEKPLPPAAKRKKKSVGGSAARTVESGGTAGGGRYTAPVPAARKGPSPRWVPVLMFGLWVLGLALILLNYMGLLPGSSDGGNGLYLVGGLAAILGGIVTATQYR